MTFNRKFSLVAVFFLVIVSVVVWRRIHRIAPPPAVIPPREEVTLTIIPGWTLRQVADYLVVKGFASTTDEVFAITGKPAVVRALRAGPPFPDAIQGLELISRKPGTISYEGYLAPETYRVFRDATLVDVIKKLLAERETEMTSVFPDDGSGATAPLGEVMSDVTVPDVMTMASIIEKETRHPEDRAIVSDILWRRYKKGWALQVDSSVHYAVDRTGDVFTTDQERAIDSPWNTYKYPGLPPGPICNPSIEAIKAALHPETNNYWYFLTGTDGKMYYGKTLDEHNLNRAKYLR